MSFQYDILPTSSSFRILELEPGNEHDPLRGIITTHSREAAPPYEALSYVWGSADRNKSMMCNGQEFNITSSLDLALRRLRLPDKFRRLWIDQICIDQISERERSHQVGIMRDIYSSAEVVNAWLGPADPEKAACAARLIHALANLGRIYVSDRPEHFPEDVWLQKNGLAVRSSSDWKVLDSMLRLPYFSRVWIIQEMVVSRAFRIIWGSVAIPGQIFNKALESAYAHSMHIWDFQLTNDCPKLHLEIACMGVQRICKCTRHDWIALLLMTRQYQATDGRDRIFALVGLADHTGYNIVPDYTKKEADVFGDFTLQTICKSRNLAILTYALVKDADRAERPLWAPRWVSSPSKDLPAPLSHEHHHASFGSDAQLGSTADPEILALRGLHVDTVKDQTPLIWDMDGILASMEVIARHGALIDRRYGENFITSLVFTWRCGFRSEPCKAASPDVQISAYPTSPPPKPYLDGFIAFALSYLLKYLLLSEEVDILVGLEILQLIQLALNARDSATKDEPHYKKDDTFNILREKLSGLRPDEYQTATFPEIFRSISIDESLAFDFQLSYLGLGMNRQFFITEKGYMGVGPPSMKPGDCLCILYGGPSPYLLRPTSTADEYLYLGDSYVQGLMHGEAMAMREGQGAPKSEELTEKWFRLR